MERKRLSGVDATGGAGEFIAVFARLGVVDHQGDLTEPGAFENGAAVKIAGWGHDWAKPPVGKGTIEADAQVARVHGKLFLDTAAGAEIYTVLKELGPACEWSYGFDIVQSEPGKNGARRILKKLKVHECSPVMVAAGIGTGTEYVKGAKPEATDAELRRRVAYELADPAYLATPSEELAAIKARIDAEMKDSVGGAADRLRELEAGVDPNTTRADAWLRAYMAVNGVSEGLARTMLAALQDRMVDQYLQSHLQEPRWVVEERVRLWWRQPNDGAQPGIV